MSAHVLWYLGIGYPSPCKRHVHPEIARMGFVRNRDQSTRIRPGWVSLFPNRLRGSQPCGCTSPDLAGHSFPFPSPGESRAHGRRSSAEERRSAKPCVAGSNPAPASRTHTRPAKWESPNLSSADSMERQPAGAMPYSAVIWGSNSNGKRNGVGSNPACLTNAKAMCGAWLGAMPCPDGSIRLTSYLISPWMTLRKDGAVAGGIPLPEDGQNLAVDPNAATFEACRAMSLPCKPDGA